MTENRQRLAAFAGLALLALLLAWLVLPRPDLGPAPKAKPPPRPAAATREAPAQALPDPQPDPDGWVRVRCALPVEVADGVVPLLVFVDEDDVEGTPVSGDLRTEWLIFSAPSTTGTGLVTLPGYEPTRLVWQADASGGIACELPDTLDSQAPGVLRVPAYTVHDPQDLTYVIACGQMVRDDGENGWATLDRSPGSCLVQGCRATGTLRLCLPGDTVRVVAGQTVTANPPIPADPLAGLGVNLRTAERGIKVVSVTPGAAADRAGVVPGDVILSIDGASTVDMGLQGFRERGIGAAGSPAQIRVLHEDGSEGSLSLVRERMDLVR